MTTTRKEIEDTSNLIAAAKLLGGQYKDLSITLPCGRVAKVLDHTARTWIVYMENQPRTTLPVIKHDPERIAHCVRQFLVLQDTEKFSK